MKKIDTLINEIKGLKKELNHLEEQVDHAKTKRDKAEQSYDGKKTDFLKQDQITLQAKDEVHKYLAESVKSSMLRQDGLDNLLYNLEEIVKQTISSLADLKEDKENSKNQIRKH